MHSRESSVRAPEPASSLSREELIGGGAFDPAGGFNTDSTMYGGLPFTSSYMCARYDAMIAKHRSWMPPMKRITTMSVANPFGASVGSDDSRDNLEDQAERGDHNDD